MLRTDAPAFAAALLAGGQSSRMGRDKALLPMPGGQLLWQRQLALLRELEPGQLLLSGMPRPGLPDDVLVVPDTMPNAGPLAGVSACLHALHGDLLLMLAVDLAHMETVFLRTLLAACRPGRGAVVQREGFYEPLAAIYPKSLAPLAAERLRNGAHAMQGFVRAAVANGALAAVKVAPDEARYFANFNTPDDLAKL